MVTILDGGMGRELKRIGAPFQQPEWSALALMQGPQFVRQAHDAFAHSGAQVLTTNSYAVVPFHIGQERFEAQGVALARLCLSPAPLWLLDEPFVALDSAACDVLQGLMQSHVTRGGMVVFTSHQAVNLSSGDNRSHRLGRA